MAFVVQLAIFVHVAWMVHRVGRSWAPSGSISTRSAWSVCMAQLRQRSRVPSFFLIRCSLRSTACVSGLPQRTGLDTDYTLSIVLCSWAIQFFNLCALALTYNSHGGPEDEGLPAFPVAASLRLLVLDLRHRCALALVSLRRGHQPLVPTRCLRMPVAQRRLRFLKV